MHLSTRHSSNQASFISPGSPHAYGMTFPCGKQKAAASEDWKSRLSSDSRDKIAAFPTQNDCREDVRSRATAVAGEAQGQAGARPGGSPVPMQPSAWPAAWRPPPQSPLSPAHHGPRGLTPRVCPLGGPAPPALRGSPSHAAAVLSRGQNHLEAPPHSASSSPSKHKTWVFASQLLIVCAAGKTIPCK